MRELKSRRFFSAIVILFSLAAGACGSSQNEIVLSPDAGPTTLSPGDSIRIIVWRSDQFSGQFGIGADGTIAHPLYQEVRASEIPLSQLDEAVTDVLREYIESPNVVVQPLIQVAVLGDVIEPGTYALPPATTLAQAIARAGGPSLTAKGSAARLLREEPGRGIVEQRLNFTDPSDLAFRETIRSGDAIVVPEKTFTTGLWIALVGALAAVALVVERFTQD